MEEVDEDSKHMGWKGWEEGDGKILWSKKGKMEREALPTIDAIP